MQHPHLHKFPKFQSATRHLQVGNGALVPALFVIPLVFKIQGHIFEVYTLVSEIQDKMDLILGVKNIFELERIVNTAQNLLSEISKQITPHILCSSP